MEDFAKLVRDYSPRLLVLAQGIVHQREAAEDVVQDALVKAYLKRHTWRGEGALSTWLYRIVYTTAVSSLRSRREFFDGPADISEAPEPENNWELTEVNIAKMRRALELLPPLDRTLVTLFYTDDKSVRECGTICGLSEVNVKVRLHRVRTRLRELMEGMQ